MDVPIALPPSLIVAGALATSIGLDITRVNAWATRFAGTFREYAIVGARLELRMNNVAVTAGILAAFLDEETAAAPTATQALNRPRLDVTVGPVFEPRAYHLDWKPADILDLDFVDTGTTFTPVWLKLYTDQTNFGTTASTSGQVIITGSLALEFRGYV